MRQQEAKKKIIIIENKALQKNLGVGFLTEKLQDIIQSEHYL